MPNTEAEKKAINDSQKSLNRLEAIMEDMAASMNKDFDPDEVWRFPEGSIGTFTDMAFWYPKIKNLVKTPKTIHVPVPDRCNLVLLCDGITPRHWDEFLENLKKAVLETGTPCFLRTGFTSNKHFWNENCLLADLDKLGRHVGELSEFSAIIDQPVTDFFVRELITTSPVFHTKYGMPVTREFRLFLVDDKIDRIQPYWPADALEKLLPAPEPLNWKERLQIMSQLTREEYAFLERETLKLREGLSNFDWSVDWLQAENGDWYLTDMARAEHSYEWEPDFPVIISE